MNEYEKRERCDGITKWKPTEDGIGRCVVYGRTVDDCRDCAFSYHARPRWLKSKEAEEKMLKIGTKLINAAHIEWGVWTITKTPDTRDDWYHIRGESGERVLHIGELHFWMKA